MGFWSWLNRRVPEDLEQDRHRPWFVWVPILGAVMWFCMLWAMLIVWLASGQQHYTWFTNGQTIPFISDVGATNLLPLYILGSVITGASYIWSVLLDRWLRHHGRLAPTNTHLTSTLASIFAWLGGLWLMLVSVFNREDFPPEQYGFLLAFMVCVLLSALFTVIESRSLGQDYIDASRLYRSYLLKGVIASVMLALSIAFAVTLFTRINVAAALEWTIAFVFTFYLLTYAYDLSISSALSARRAAAHQRIDSPQPEMVQQPVAGEAGPSAPAGQVA